ncbi:putative pentatricopeptide repeat-containing protein [Tripterygium wilfordii]|uniref:Putative pentatricopeptide repeat-containing protein n=1 Tax=Tripterygium wilfordii TaxID=458696 RepID=A0A7J7CFH1_TRIWF|nr:putative pentatricopeptide repeat-containing protein [Tripterygium wilfordii]
MSTKVRFLRKSLKEDSEATLRSCCVAAHILAAEDLRLWAQDVVSRVFGRIGAVRSRGLVKFMWGNHHEYESDFSVLDTLMRVFLNVEMGCEALEIVHWMRKVGAKPSLSAIGILFKFLLRVGDYGSVWKLFRSMVREGPRPSNRTFNMMILGFCQESYVQIAESLLHVMWKYWCEPDVVAYNILINAYCSRGLTSDALKWMQLMIERDCKPSAITFNTIINALCNEGNLFEARKIFDDTQDMGISPNVIMYNTLMNGYVKARDIDQANMLYEKMMNRGIAPDGVTFNILVAGHYKYGREEDGDRLLRDLSVQGRMRSAVDAFIEMHRAGLSADIVTYNTLIGGYCKAFDMDSAEEFVKKMYTSGWDPDITTYNIRIHGFCSSRKMNRAVMMLDELISAGIVPNTATYNTMMNGVCSDILERAMIIAAKLIKMAFVPNVITANNMSAEVICGE